VPAITDPHPVPSTDHVTAGSAAQFTVAVKICEAPLSTEAGDGERTTVIGRMVYVAETGALSWYPAACAIARTVAVWPTVSGAVYRADAPVGSLPSVVYRIDAPAVADDKVTVTGAKYVPACGEKVGAAAGAEVDGATRTSVRAETSGIVRQRATTWQVVSTDTSGA
jgi:hypothetical protein